MKRIALFGCLAALLAPLGPMTLPTAPLPVPEKSDDFAKVCDTLGPGYQVIPGTTTCVKIGGFVRMDMNVSPSPK